MPVYELNKTPAGKHKAQSSKWLFAKEFFILSDVLTSSPLLSWVINLYPVLVQTKLRIFGLMTGETVATPSVKPYSNSNSCAER